MKRFVSALIAGAMILSMSVVSFAADVVFGSGPKNSINDTEVETLDFYHAKVYRNDERLVVDGKDGYTPSTFDPQLEAGDVIYFAVGSTANKTGNTYNDIGEADENWVIKINAAHFVDSAEFVYDEKCEIGDRPMLWVKVELEDNFNHFETKDSKFFFYIYDRKDNNGAKESERVNVYCQFADYAEETLTKNDIKTIVPLKLNTIYTLDEDVKSAKVVFGYDDMYITAKLYAGEEYLVNSITTKYNKDMAIKYDADVEVISIVSNMDNYDVFFESSKDNKFIYEVVENELVSVEATYMNKYEIIKGEYILTEGYLVEYVEDNQWVVLDKEIVSVNESEEDKEEVKPSTPSTDKANPETGAGDFVGMASTMAVMAIVAGAGLMISKK